MRGQTPGFRAIRLLSADRGIHHLSVPSVACCEKAVRLFRTWLDANPRWSWGWIGWADCYAFAPANRRDLDRAERILQEGLAIEGLEEKDVFYERLEHVFEQQGRHEKVAQLKAALKAQAKAAATPVRRDAPEVGRNDPSPAAAARSSRNAVAADRRPASSLTGPRRWSGT
jgi:hypothetical protein